EGNRRALESLFLYVGGLMLVGSMIFTFEYTIRSYMHGSQFYWVVALAVPWKLAAISRASHRRFAAPWLVGVYSLFLLAMLWGLPLFPAEPKRGPGDRPVTQLIP